MIFMYGGDVKLAFLIIKDHYPYLYNKYNYLAHAFWGEYCTLEKGKIIKNNIDVGVFQGRKCRLQNMLDEINAIKCLKEIKG